MPVYPCAYLRLFARVFTRNIILAFHRSSSRPTLYELMDKLGIGKKRGWGVGYERKAALDPALQQATGF